MVYQLYREQRLPIPLEEAWDFFSSPDNLKEITPGFMGFDILSKTERADIEGVDIEKKSTRKSKGKSGKKREREGGKMFAGQIIRYKVRPLWGIALLWVTEIGPLVEKSYFVDRQLVGPYRLWHHKHLFQKIKGGTLIQDIVDYQLSFGPLGSLAHLLFVRRQLSFIFDWRQRRLLELFGPYS